MRHATFMLPASLALLLGASAQPTAATPPPTGAISCSVVGKLEFRPFLPSVSIPPSASGIRVRVKNAEGVCDNSGVTGGRAPITAARVSLVGRFPKDATCADLVSAPPFETTRIAVKWQGLRPSGRPFTVATSKATLAGASYDGGSDAVVLVTQPIARGAFAGSAITLHLGLDDIAGFTTACGPGSSAAFLFTIFGQGNPSTIDVP